MKLITFFQLIRWKNLLFIFAVQFLIKFYLIPKFELISIFSNLDFFLVASSTLFITAAGYIINDIIDVDIDIINKGESTIINRNISIKSAKYLFYLFNSIGLIVGVWVSFKTNKIAFSVFFISIIILLFLYSKILKSIPILGNIVVSLLISLCILIIAFFEQYQMNSYVLKIIFMYSFFAFLINLIREIIKDIEDINGDYAGEMNTLPILIGRKRTNSIARMITIFLILFILAVLVFYDYQNLIIKYYGVLVVILPLLYFISRLTISKSKKDYHKLSSLLKGIMVLGILSIFTL